MALRRIIGRRYTWRFRTVHLDPKTIGSGRIFFCQHFDPDLVWRDEWRTHPNTVTGIAVS